MRIIFINLARAQERRLAIEAELKARALAGERLEAIDGLHITDADRARVDERRRKRITPFPLSDNEIGCWLSHEKALKGIAQGSAPMAAVLEDDARLAVEFSAVLEAIEQKAPPFDFIFLHRNMKRGEVFVPTHDLVPGLRLGRVGPAHMRAIGYVVSRKGARRFLEYAPRFGHMIDKEIHRYWANKLDIYGLERAIVVHDDDGRSFIEETRKQENSSARVRYPDANDVVWRFRRLLTRLEDSTKKRIAWRRLRKG